MTRHPIRSTGNPTVSFTGPPMSEARRQHIHGKLQAMRPEGEPGLFTGMLIVVGGFILIAALVMVVEGMML